jgi:hypothetical protein
MNTISLLDFDNLCDTKVPVRVGNKYFIALRAGDTIMVCLGGHRHYEVLDSGFYTIKCSGYNLNLSDFSPAEQANKLLAQVSKKNQKTILTNVNERLASKPKSPYRTIDYKSEVRIFTENSFEVAWVLDL